MYTLVGHIGGVHVVVASEFVVSFGRSFHLFHVVLLVAADANLQQQQQQQLRELIDIGS